jgi:hypothetical protein
MSTFLYYAAQSFACRIEEHLRDRLEAGMHQQAVLRGPDTANGMLFAAADRLDRERLKYRPDEQHWELVGAMGDYRPAYWLGTLKGEEPSPENLVRKKTLPGHTVDLADGHRWLCPVARGQAAQDGRLVWYHTLPRTLVLQPETDRLWGEGNVVPRYARLWHLAGQYWQARVGSAMPDASAGEEVSFDFQGAAAAAVECLATNYRVSAIEVSRLGLLDTDAPRKILDALIDWPTLVKLSAELQKKTESAASAG